MRGLNPPQSLSFSLGTLGARVQICFWSAQAAPYPHIFQPEDQSSEKSRPSVNMFTVRKPEKCCILKSALFYFFFLTRILLASKVPQSDLLVSFKWQVHSLNGLELQNFLIKRIWQRLETCLFRMPLSVFTTFDFYYFMAGPQSQS